MRRPPVLSRTLVARAGAPVTGRRPRWRAGVALAAVMLLAVPAACNDKPGDADADDTTEQSDPELIPFDTLASDSGPADTEPEVTEPQDTEPEDTEPEDTEPEDTEPDVQEIDPMPGDTATFDTRPPEDDLCEAAQAILDADDEYQSVLEDALEVAAEDPDALVRALGRLPLEDIRRAYDDLENEVPQNMRGRVALVRDFTLEHGAELVEVESLEQLSELIVAMEDDKDAPRVTRALQAVSAYTEDECGIPIRQGG